MRRARGLVRAPFEAATAQLPEPLNRLDFDAYRDIRFRPDKALLGGGRRAVPDAAVPSRLPLQRPVTVNVIRDGVPTPVPYQRELFDYGRNKIERPLPVNLGFAGFRLHYPLNDPKVLGRADRLPRRELFPLPRAQEQQYGLSARGLAIDVEGGEARGVPAFPRVLDRDARARRRPRRHLRPARRPVA